MAAPTHISSGSAANSTTTPKTVAAGTRAVGDLVTVFVLSASGTNTYTVSDGLGNTYTKVAEQAAGGRYAAIWYTVVTTGGSLTVSVAATGGVSYAVGVCWASPPVGATISFDVAGVFNGSVSSTTHPCAAVGGINTASDVILYSCTAGGTFTSTTPATGFTLTVSPLANRMIVWRQETATALTAERATFSSGSSTDHQGAVASFKAVTSGGNRRRRVLLGS